MRLAGLAAALRDWLATELRSAGARHSAITLAGSLGRLGLGFLASVLIARTLGPAGYGLIALLSLVASVLDTVADFGLTYTAVHAVARKLASGIAAARPIAAGYWSLTLLLNATGAVAGFALAEPIARLALGRPDAEPSIRLVVLGLVTVAGNGACAALLQGTRRFERLALVQVFSQATYLAGVVVLAVAGRLTVEAVVLLGVLNPLIGFVIGLRLLPSGLLDFRAGFGAPGRHAWGELTRFSRWLWVSSMLSLLAAQLDLALVGRWLPAVEVGLYALALNLATKLDILNQARFTVLLPSVASLGAGAELRTHVHRTLIRSAALGFPLLLAFPLAGPLVGLLYGTAYLDAVPVLLVLVVAVVFDLLTTPLLLLAFPLNAPRVLAASDVVRVALLVGLASALVPVLGPVGAALAKLGAKVAGAAVTLAALWWLAAPRGARHPPPPPQHREGTVTRASHGASREASHG
ncbi:MAG TPA: oligosaccharide flippase family protein [Chloroflexota bacterium]|nr:oligosaccharide flippase family protein [Chloroflexota bacterium]